MTTYWRMLATVDSILKEFGWRYTGKSSPSITSGTSRSPASRAQGARRPEG